MKKITFFIGSMEEGGAERVLSNLTAYLADKGHPVQLLTYHDREPFYPIDPRVETVSVCRETGSTGILKNLRWMRRFFSKNSAVVVSFLAVFNMMAILAAMGTRVPVLVADRNDPRFVPANFAVRKARDLLYRFARGVVVQTNHNKRYFSKTVQKKSVIIFNPLDLGARSGEALRTPKEELIVSVSRLMPQKNQTMLLRAFAKICEEFPGLRLVIYGEGSARTELEALVASLSLRDRVMLPGSEKRVFDEICPARLFVLSSNYEGMPNALAEAMCLGLPCISTAVSGATDMIRDGENGMLVRVKDEEQLANAMRSLLLDPARAEKMAEEATELNQVLDKAVIAERWREYILSFCDGEAEK